jgi:hypothetical protein
VAWPGHAPEPIDEFSVIDFLARVYPDLFPKGNCQFRAVRRITVTAEEFFLHLLRHKSGRFRLHRRFRYTALNCMLRWRSMSISTVYVNRTQAHKSVDDIVEEVSAQFAHTHRHTHTHMYIDHTYINNIYTRVYKSCCYLT